MTKLDTLLNIDQSLQLRGIANLNKAQLAVTLANNVELKRIKNDLNTKIDEVNKLLVIQNNAQIEIIEHQKNILQNQIIEIERRETQKFHKKRVFIIKEYIIDYENLNDSDVKNYLLKRFLPVCLEYLHESKNVLDEIFDKEYCLDLINKVIKLIDNNLDGSFSEIFSLEKIALDISNYESDLMFWKESEFKLSNELIKLKSKLEYINSDEFKKQVNRIGDNKRWQKFLFGFTVLVLIFYLIGLANSEPGKNSDDLNIQIFILFILIILTFYFSYSIYFKKVKGKNEIGYEEFKNRVKFSSQSGKDGALLSNAAKQDLNKSIIELEAEINEINDRINIIDKKLFSFREELLLKRDLYYQNHMEINRVTYAVPDFFLLFK